MQTELLTIKQVAARVGVCESTVRNWLRGYYSNQHGLRPSNCKFVPFTRIGGSIRIKASDLNRWLEARTEDLAGIARSSTAPTQPSFRAA